MMMSAFLLSACGGGTTQSDGSGGPCQSNSDCSDGMVCVSFGSVGGACTPQCGGSVTECSASASCTGVGSLSVSVCQEKVETQGEAKPEEQPRIPCTTDAECDAIHAGAVCAQWKGERDCTILCSANSDCEMPEMAGMKMDFMDCLNDERTDVDVRTVCLPDEKCFQDVGSCVQIPGVGGLDGDFGDLPGFGDSDGAQPEGSDDFGF